jgi:MFS family permease
LIGITGTETTEPLRKVLHEEGASLYPLIALSALATVNSFQGYALSVLSPDIARSLGLGIGALIAARSLSFFAIALSPLPMAWLAQRKAWRGMLSILTGVAWSLLTIYTGWIVGIAGLVIVLIFDGLTTGSVQALHVPLLMDSYPPRVRVRALSAYAALGDIGLANILSPLMVAGLVSIFMLTWRGVFLVMGILSLLGTSIAFRLRDPGFGRFDTERIRKAVHEAHGEGAMALEERSVRLGFFEVLRRIFMIPTARRLAIGTMVLGIFAIPASTFISFFLDERFGVAAFASLVLILGGVALGTGVARPLRRRAPVASPP